MTMTNSEIRMTQTENDNNIFVFVPRHDSVAVSPLIGRSTANSVEPMNNYIEYRIDGPIILCHVCTSAVGCDNIIKSQ